MAKDLEKQLEEALKENELKRIEDEKQSKQGLSLIFVFRMF